MVYHIIDKYLRLMNDSGHLQQILDAYEGEGSELDLNDLCLAHPSTAPQLGPLEMMLPLG